MKVKVLEREKKLFEGEADRVVLPAVQGEMCILPHHMSIITPIVAGKLRIFRRGVERPLSIPVNSGVFSFSDDTAVFVL